MALLVRTEVTSDDQPTLAIAWSVPNAHVTSRRTAYTVDTTPACLVYLTGHLRARELPLPLPRGHFALLLDAPLVTLLVRCDPQKKLPPQVVAYWHGDAMPAAMAIARNGSGSGLVPVPGQLEHTCRIPIPGALIA